MVFALVAVSTIFAIAQKGADGKGKGKRHFGNRGHHRGGFGRMAAKLNLTDAQKEQVKQIMEASRAKTESLREASKVNRKKMHEATANGQFDEATVSAIAQEQAGISAQLTVEKLRVKSQMFQILTAEQKAQMAQMKEQRKERFKNRKNKFEKKAEQPTNSNV